MSATLLLLPGLAAAQAPTITGLTPGRNANNAPQDGPVTVTFSQPVTGASNVRVFTNQRRGQRAGTATGDGTTQVSFQPSQRYAPGEQVSVTVPATVRGTGAGTPTTAGAVYQFRAATGAGGASAVFGGTSGFSSISFNGYKAPAVADVNNDGNLDLLVTQLGYQVSLCLGDGQGGLGAPTPVQGGLQSDITMADVNNDGNLDMIISGFRPRSSPSVFVCLGNGLGGFGESTAFAPNSVGQVRVGDVNADGNLDIVAVARLASQPTLTLCVRLGNGQGSFAAGPNVALDPDARSFHLADFNNDGQLDCLVENEITNTFKSYLGNGQGDFTLNNTTAVARLGTNEVADVTGDGNLDLLMADGTAGAVRLLPGTGQGGFGTEISLPLPGASTVHAADVNNDGRLDILANYNNGPAGAGLARWLNQSGSAFAPPILMTNCAGTYLTTGDMNNDGALDVMLTDRGISGTIPNVKVRLNNAVLTTRPAANPLNATCYPNPVHGTAHVVLPQGATKGLQAEVYNTLGQCVYYKQLNAVLPGATATLDVSTLSPGLYTLRLTADKRTATHQLVVE